MLASNSWSVLKITFCQDLFCRSDFPKNKPISTNFLVDFIFSRVSETQCHPCWISADHTQKLNTMQRLTRFALVDATMGLSTSMTCDMHKIYVSVCDNPNFSVVHRSFAALHSGPYGNGMSIEEERKTVFFDLKPLSFAQCQIGRTQFFHMLPSALKTVSQAKWDKGKWSTTWFKKHLKKQTKANSQTIQGTQRKTNSNKAHWQASGVWKMQLYKARDPATKLQRSKICKRSIFFGFRSANSTRLCTPACVLLKKISLDTSDPLGIKHKLWSWWKTQSHPVNTTKQHQKPKPKKTKATTLYRKAHECQHAQHDSDCQVIANSSGGQPPASRTQNAQGGRTKQVFSQLKEESIYWARRRTKSIFRSGKSWQNKVEGQDTSTPTLEISKNKLYKVAVTCNGPVVDCKQRAQSLFML